MAGDDEEPICRVCRCPSTPEQPLYYPCKCSGSMKYVHQDCLEEWLQHSRKRQCEICNYAFSFTPIYSDRAPDRISITFFLSVVSRRVLSMMRLYLRVFFAAFVWLIWVPYVTVWVWRMYFNPSLLFQSIAFRHTWTWGSNAWDAFVPYFSLGNGTMMLNATEIADGSARAVSLEYALRNLDYRRMVNIFFTDVFEGQIIASIAVVICLAFLCLKEYVVMNTPVDAQGNPVNAVDENVAPHALVPAPVADRAVRPIFIRRERAPLNDIARQAAVNGPANVQGAQDIREADDSRVDNVADWTINVTASTAPNDADVGERDTSGFFPSSGMRRRRLSMRRGSSSSFSDQEMEEERQVMEDIRRQSTRAPLRIQPPRRVKQLGDPSEPRPLIRKRSSDKGLTYEPIDRAKAIAEIPNITMEDIEMMERNRILISAAAYDEKRYRERRSLDKGKGKGKAIASSPEHTDDESKIQATDGELGVRPSAMNSMNGSTDLASDLSVFEGKYAAGGSDSKTFTYGEWEGTFSDGKRPSTSIIESAKQGENSRASAPMEEPAVATGSSWSSRISTGSDEPWTTISASNPMSPFDASARTTSATSNTEEVSNTYANLNSGPQAEQLPADPPVEPPLAQAQPPGPAPVLNVPPAPPGPPAAAADAFQNQNGDANPNNDVNAFLELVGVQGPLENLAQNVAMVILVIVMALGVGVWIPYLTGRVMVWLIRDLYSPSLEWCIGKLQRLTDPVLDPIVDVAMFGVRLLGVGNATRGAKVLVDIAANTTTHNLTAPQTDLAVRNMSSLDARAVVENAESARADASEYANISELLAQVEAGKDEPLAGKLNAKENESAAVVELAETSSTQQIGDHKQRTEHRRRKTGEAKKGKRIWGLPDKALYTLVGYVTQCFFILDYSRRTGLLHHPYARTIRRIMVKWLLYMLMAIKFSFFLTVELGIFPFFCGVLIDLCTLPLFGPNATIASRWAFYNAHPWTSEFLHWLAGTTFMFQFAMYVSTIREVVRPGVMWFIRDPNDPQFHPMNDILERPVLTQLRKLAVGTVMYAAMVLGGVGGFVGFVWCIDRLSGVKEGPGKIWPLQWDLSEPMSEFPIDLLIFHFVVPWTVAWIRPKRILRRIVDVWFRWTARQLRLTGFLFGGTNKEEESDDEIEVEEEEGTEEIIYHEDTTTDVGVGNGIGASNEPHTLDPATMANGLQISYTVDNAEDADKEQGDWEDEEVIIFNGPGPLSENPTRRKRKRRRPRREYRYMRVPNHDHVEVIPGQKMLIPIRNGDTLKGREGEAEEDIKVNWTKVYVPNRFKLRIAALLLFQWVCGVLLMATVIIGPLYLGRAFFGSVVQWLPDVHIFSSQASNIDKNVTSTNATSVFPLVDTPAVNGTIANVTAVMPRTIRPDLPVHDMYSYAFGLFIVLMVVYPVIRLSTWITHIRRTMSQSIRRTTQGRRTPGEAATQVAGAIDDTAQARAARRTSLRRKVGRGLKYAYRWAATGAKVGFLGLMICLVVPLMVGLVFDLYLIQPFKPLGGVRGPNGHGSRYIGLDFSNPMTHAILQALLQDWALGAVYVKIAWALVMVGPETEVKRVLGEFARGGVQRVRVRPMLRTIILPLLSICAGLAAGPWVIGFGVQMAMKDKAVGAESLRWIFPGTLLLSLLAALIWQFVRAVNSWMEKVKEEEFLVGRKLHNLDEPKEVEVGMVENGGEVVEAQADERR